MSTVLFVANHPGFFKFNQPYMKWFHDQGWLVDSASPGNVSGYCDRHFSVLMERTPYSLKNLKAYSQLKRIIIENNYRIIHCHTPMGGFLARLAAREARKRGTKIIYTAHGFHFYKGSRLFNWVIYYSIERFLVKFTDCIVTINEEDFLSAKKMGYPPERVYRINGVGVDLARFHLIDVTEKSRQRLLVGFSESDFVLLYIAQFIKRKNHVELLSVLNDLKTLIPQLQVVLVGDGKLKVVCMNYSKKNKIDTFVHFLGERSDIENLCAISDIHVSTSRQEGLSLNNIEAMASGLPLICSRIRGHVDVLVDGRNGILYELGNKEQLKEAIYKMYSNKKYRDEVSRGNVLDSSKYSLACAINSMGNIYSRYM